MACNNVYRGNDYPRRPSRQEQQKAAEIAFLKRQSAIERSPVHGEKVGTERQVNPTKRWRPSEEETHTELSKFINVAYDYLRDGDDLYFKMLENRSSILGIRCSNPEKVRDALKQALDKRKLYEVKMLYNLAKKENGEQAVAQYLKDKRPEERFHSVKSLLEYFRDHPNDSNLEICNKIMKSYGMEIVAIPNRETPVHDRQVLRAVFDGFLKIPEKDKATGEVGYSAGYIGFASPQGLQGAQCETIKAPESYDFENNAAIRAMQMSENLENLIPAVKSIVRKSGMPAEVFDGLSMSDIAHMLYTNKYKREPQAGETISLTALNENCTEGVKQRFWLEFGKDTEKRNNLKKCLENRNVDPNFIADLLVQIKENGSVTLPDADNKEKYNQPVPTLSLHHKFYIQDAVFLGDKMKVDSLSNFEVIVDYAGQETHDDLKHGADCVSEDGNTAYRLVYIDDGKGNDYYLTAGLEDVYSTARGQESSRVTYNKLAGMYATEQKGKE